MKAKFARESLNSFIDSSLLDVHSFAVQCYDCSYTFTQTTYPDDGNGKGHG